MNFDAIKGVISALDLTPADIFPYGIMFGVPLFCALVVMISVTFRKHKWRR